LSYVWFVCIRYDIVLLSEDRERERERERKFICNIVGSV